MLLAISSLGLRYIRRLQTIFYQPNQIILCTRPMSLAVAVTIGCIFYANEDGLAASISEVSSGLPHVPPGRWVKIHEQAPTDSVFFKRQAHGGSAFDIRRGQLVLFGSDTHGKDWKNSPYFFDIKHLKWSRLYPEDDQATYRVNSEGIPVAGPEGDHPWAMHTFGAVAYHELRDQLIVSSHPKHMEPGRFTDRLANIWPKVARHPTWIFDLSSEKWVPLKGESVSFFPYATVYDSDRGMIIGYKTTGIYELSGNPGTWRQVVNAGLLGYGNNAAYDSRHRAVVVFGSHKKSNDIVIYEPATKRHQVMPTAGIRPPRDTSTPMAFHAGIGRTVVLADRTKQNAGSTANHSGYAETWLYDLSEDSWTNIETATLPFEVGMNYNMEYDPTRNLLLLVANAPDEPTAVWALRP